MSACYKYVFGPVPSRRLGRSLGVDLVPAKYCTFDCVYCQAGKTTDKTVQRAAYVPSADVFAELDDWLAAGGSADYVTFSGNGEPTLNSELGEVIRWVKGRTSIPVAVITNGSLLYREDVREDLAAADLVVPSLDTTNGQTFRRLNRPEPSLNIETIIAGLIAFTKGFVGEVWVEHFIVPGINDTPAELTALAEADVRIRPSRVQLNTAVRPPAETTVRPMSPGELYAIAERYFPGAEVIPAYEHTGTRRTTAADDPTAVATSLIARRPITADDLAKTAGIDIHLAEKVLVLLVKKGAATAVESGGKRYYKTIK